jgi:hypothetical protein
LVLNALVYVVAALLVHIVVNRGRKIAVDWNKSMSIDYGFKIRLSLLNMSRCIPDLQRRQALGCEGKSAVGGRIETHKLSISALKDAMHICCLHIDLIRIVVLVQEIILLHVSLSIESTEK